MNSLKKPETVITLINTAALLGASIYFYKKTNNLELELNKHSEHLTLTVKKVKEIANTKKHIAALADAIKKLNHSLGSQNNDIEMLKEIIKYQNNQIKELHTFVLSLRDEENKEEFKLKENPHIQYIMYPSYQNQNYRQQVPQRQPQQQMNPRQYNQGYQQPRPESNQGYSPPRSENNQGYPQGHPQGQQNFQNGNQLPPPQRGESLIDLGFKEQQSYSPQPRYPQQGAYQQMNQGYYQNSPQQGYNQPMNQGYQESYDEGIDDEDAAIDAVRRARQQNDNPLSGLF